MDRPHNQTLYLHIGTMKSGTSYVQGGLDYHRDRLAAAGIRYPGSVGPAVHEVLEKRGARHFGEVEGSWNALAADTRRWPGPSILSMEFLGLASPEQAQRIVESFGSIDVRILMTTRDLGRTLPSAWQQTTKNRQAVSWADWLQAVIAHDLDDEVAARPDVESLGRAAHQFWAHHDIPGIIDTWASVVNRDAITIITVPPRGSDPDELWRRFATATNLDVGHFPPPPDARVRSNTSLGLAGAETMRRLNNELGRSLDQPSYRRLVTGFVSRRVLRGVSHEPVSVIELPAPALAWASGRAHQIVEEIRSKHVRIVGSLDDLIPTPAAATATTATTPNPDEAEVASHAIAIAAALLQRLAEVEAQDHPEQSSERASRRAARRKRDARAREADHDDRSGDDRSANAPARPRKMAREDSPRPS